MVPSLTADFVVLSAQALTLSPASIQSAIFLAKSPPMLLPVLMPVQMVNQLVAEAYEIYKTHH
ncbi:hypothetical protein ID11_09360 [Pantoea vagans]|nr:hypothetical protein ID11_09360 [Pantoea vagans]